MVRAGFLLTALCALALALPGPADAAGGWRAKMTLPTHTPKARAKWPVKIVVKTSSGRPLSGTVQYHFLFGGQVVSTQGCHPNRPDPCSFKGGVYRDLIRWPKRSAGYKLTFQATVKTKLGTKNLNYWVKVRR
jgi:hypothetical protein